MSKRSCPATGYASCARSGGDHPPAKERRRRAPLRRPCGLTGIAKSAASKPRKDIDQQAMAFLDRPLSGERPYLWRDATCLRQREGGRGASVAAIIAVACDPEGRRQIVGLHIRPSDVETFSATFPKSLVKRGLRGVKLDISTTPFVMLTSVRFTDVDWRGGWRWVGSLGSSARMSGCGSCRPRAMTSSGSARWWISRCSAPSWSRPCRAPTARRAADPPSITC